MKDKTEKKICWRITRRCNLHCLHCLAGLKNLEKSDLRQTEHSQILPKIATAGVTRITWTGGEPSLVRHLPTLIQVAHSFKLQTVLTTHGLCLTPTLIAALDPVYDSARVSIDGAEKTHNRIRGGEFFRRTMQTIETLSSLGHNTEANVSVMQMNAGEIPELLPQLASAGVSKIVLLSLMQRESAKLNGLKPASELAFAELHDHVLAFADQYADIEVVLYDYYDPEDAYIVLEADGDITLCSERGDRSFGYITSANGAELLKEALDRQTLAHKKPLLQPA